MNQISQEDINAIHAEAGDSLRIIVEYDRENYDVQYIRDDIEDKFQAVAEEVHDDLVMQGMGKEFLEQLFQGGDLHCSVHRFDELTAFHFPREKFTGLFVSIDSDSGIQLSEFADACYDAL